MIRNGCQRGLLIESSRNIALRNVSVSDTDGLDLTQWYHILNIEAEADFAPDGFGPFDVFQGFLRVEVRYDCVWTRACGIFSAITVAAPGRVIVSCRPCNTRAGQSINGRESR